MKKQLGGGFLLFVAINVCADPEQVHALDKMVVNSSVYSQEAKTVLPVVILSGRELMMASDTTLGEVLKDELGVVSQSFGPGVGQAVIRGQSGSRVYVLQDGLGSLDVASLSPDHANSTEALWAESVEVLRGPSTLLYGSGAIGGIVNVIDNRIPSVIPEKALQGALEQRYNTINEGKISAVKLQGGLHSFAWHVDGTYRDSLDMQLSEPSNLGQRLKNTNTNAYSGNAGASMVGEHGFIGFSVSRLDNNYGIPSAEEQENVRIDMQQNRYNLKAEIFEPFSFAESLKLRAAYNDYQHIELENGQAGTVYQNRGFESRAELVYTPWWFFDQGVVGGQVKQSQFSAIGEESIVPASDIDSVAVFTVQNIHTENINYEFGLRVERQWVYTDNDQSKMHTPVSFSAAALWHMSEQDTVGLTFLRSQRAPAIQELFSNGAHLATHSYEIGDADLIEETSYSIELGLHFDRGWVKADVNVFQNWVFNYIAQGNTGTFFDLDNEAFSRACAANCLPVFQLQQRDAYFYGAEAQARFPMIYAGTGYLESRLFADYVRGQFNEGGDIPRMPPLRYGMALSWEDLKWMTQVKIMRADGQDHVGINELETQGYWSLNASANYTHAVTQGSEVTYFVKANNLLDADIRNSVSFLREIAPEAGRGVEVGLRINF